jgi:ankyrin repeat protein
LGRTGYAVSVVGFRVVYVLFSSCDQVTMLASEIPTTYRPMVGTRRPDRRKRRTQRDWTQDIMKLDLAVRNGPNNPKQSYSIVKGLLERGTPVDGKSPNSPSPLEIASFYGLFDIVDLLITYDADIDFVYPSGRSILFMAVGYSLTDKGNLELVNRLIECGADVSHKASAGHTILHSTERLTFDQVIMEAILAAGADINALSDTNETPLHVAAREGNYKFVDFFLQNNASIDAVNDEGLTAVEVAQITIDEFENDMDEEMDDEELEEFDLQIVPWYVIIQSIEDEQQRREELRLEELRQQKCLAVMMAHHTRLGEESIINSLDPDVSRFVLQFV